MSNIPTITINLDHKCAECGKGGASGNSLCMACTTKAIKGQSMKTEAGRRVAQNWKQIVASVRRGKP